MAEPIVPKGFGPPLGMYSHGMVVKVGELVIVAGQVGLTSDGRPAALMVLGPALKDGSKG